ncbi:MAG: hypothetical protein ACK4K8_00650 [Pannonibacter sp.]
MVLDSFDTSTLVAAEALGRLTGEIRAAGLTLEESADFAAFEQAAQASEDQYLMEDFSSRFFDLHASNAFWIGVRDGEGKVASLQAAKVEDLRDRPLAVFWQQQQRRIFADPTGGTARLGGAHAADAFELSGRIVYHGNLWLRRDLRGRGLAEKLTQTGFLVALLKWQPDWLYGLMAETNALKGFGLRVGYRRFAPRGTHWIVPPAHIRPDDWLVWSSRADLVTLARDLSARLTG